MDQQQNYPRSKQGEPDQMIGHSKGISLSYDYFLGKLAHGFEIVFDYNSVFPFLHVLEPAHQNILQGSDSYCKPVSKLAGLYIDPLTDCTVW